MKHCPVCGTEYSDEVKFCPNDGQTLHAAAPAADLVGQIVADRYHVIKKLGEGGMGQVYLAEHVKMGRRIAIKVMNPAMVHDPDAVARFNREATNTSRITHPNVCTIHDFGEMPDGTIYLVMEFVEGDPLTDVLEREGALPLSRAIPVFLQTADALQAAHDLGIVHRDLKPDNVMVARGRRGSDVVKVVDFGIAKAIAGEAGQQVTKTGLVVGTPEFMSPEQLAGDRLDGRSDLYSLALVLFRMVTGRLPFEAESVQETMIKRLTDAPLTLAATRPDLTFPPGLQACLDAALARSPVDRYQTVAKFADDVAAVTGIAQRGASAPMPATRADEEQTQLLDAAATQAMTPRPGAVARPARPRRFGVALVAGAIVLAAAGGAAWLLLGPEAEPRPGGDGTVAVPQDTAGRPAVGDSLGATAPARGRRQAGGVAPERAAGGRIADSVAMFAALDTLLADHIDANPRMVLDSATRIHDAGSVPRVIKAYAAFVMGNAWFQLDDRVRGCELVREAVRLAPADPTYPRVADQCRD